ncbi:MAG: Inhibitor of vertebrate lysozyme (Ivy) [Deltaproteobacteria bacterium]|nr:Inhibitor of vertebrate lysozyme (Ivy) [Deltaproteobacteria bacterium]
MKKINVILTIISAALFFSGSLLYAQVQNKVPVPKKGKSQVVIEYVSFPDQYKKYEVYPWETLKLEDFQKSFSAMTREGKFEDWVRSLTGTATNKNRMIRAFKQQFLLIVSCKPHLCDTSQIVVLYDPVRKHAYSIFASDGQFHFFGQPSDNIRDLLNILLVDEFKAIYRGQS